MARVACHRVRRVTVRNGVEPAVAAGACDEIAGLREIVRHRLVTDHVESCVECGRGLRVMRIVRRHDRNGVDAIVATRFVLEHFRDVAVASCGVDSDLRSRGS